MILERVLVERQGQQMALLKGELPMQARDGGTIYFTAAPLGEVPLDSDCTHDAAEIEGAEAAAAAARVAVKRGRCAIVCV
jgi:hypothetical protein